MSNGYTQEVYWSNGIKKWRKVPKEVLSKEEVKQRLAEIQERKEEEIRVEFETIPSGIFSEELEEAIERYEEALDEVLKHPGNRRRNKTHELLICITRLNPARDFFVYRTQLENYYDKEINTSTIGDFLRTLVNSGYGIDEELREEANKRILLTNKKLKHVQSNLKIVDTLKVHIGLINGDIQPEMFVNQRKKH